jgi:hypothetical protein
VKGREDLKQALDILDREEWLEALADLVLGHVDALRLPTGHRIALTRSQPDVKPEWQ